MRVWISARATETVIMATVALAEPRIGADPPAHDVAAEGEADHVAPRPCAGSGSVWSEVWWGRHQGCESSS